MAPSPPPGARPRAEPLTGRELAARVIADHGIDGDREAIRHVIDVRLTLVQVPPRGLWGESGQPKYAEPRRGPGATDKRRSPWTT